jgi:hypothetical protein
VVWRTQLFSGSLSGLQPLLRFQSEALFHSIAPALPLLEIAMRAVGLIAVLMALGLVRPAWSQDKVYAALNANNEGNLQVRWGATEAEAKERAAEACRQVSKTCSSDPASTNVLDDVFVYYCCTAPVFSCASPPHETRERAIEEAKTMMSTRGYQSCTPRAYYSARTGAKQ